MVKFLLHENVVVELPKIKSGFRPLKKSIDILTLEKARQICLNLKLPKIKVEVVKNLQKHLLYVKDAKFGFYVPPNEIPENYPIDSGAALVVIIEDDSEFLVTLFHEFGHAEEPESWLKENHAELWAWLWAFFIFHKAACHKEAEKCWRYVLDYKCKK